MLLQGGVLVNRKGFKNAGLRELLQLCGLHAGEQLPISEPWDFLTCKIPKTGTFLNLNGVMPTAEWAVPGDPPATEVQSSNGRSPDWGDGSSRRANFRG